MGETADLAVVYVAAFSNDRFFGYVQTRHPGAEPQKDGSFRDGDTVYRWAPSSAFLRADPDARFELGPDWARMPGSGEILARVERASQTVSWRSQPPPETILVATPRVDWFESYVDVKHQTQQTGSAPSDRVRIRVGRTTYRLVRTMQEARGWESSTPLALARGWERIIGVELLIERFTIRGE